MTGEVPRAPGMSGGSPVSAAAEVQRRLWGTDPRAWADLSETHNQPLFEAVLDAAGVGAGTRLLDVGCGPFGDGAFDAVVGVNAFQFAGDPRRALREAARVARPQARVVASLFAAPGRSQGTAVHEALSALIPPAQADDDAPYALSAPGRLEAAMTGAGLRIADRGEVVCAWRYASAEEAVRGFVASAGGARAVEVAGLHAVRDVLRRTVAQFQDAQTGAVTLTNTFRWVAALRV